MPIYFAEAMSVCQSVMVLYILDALQLQMCGPGGAPLSTNSGINHHRYLDPGPVAQHVAHPLTVGKVIGSNLGSTQRHNYRR